MDNFKGNTAVITGAASGIGLALAQRAAAEGMNLVLADIDIVALDKVAATLGDEPGRLLTCRVAVSKADELKGLADAAYERFGAVHMLFNNAGVGLGRVIWEYSAGARRRRPLPGDRIALRPDDQAHRRRRRGPARHQRQEGGRMKAPT